MPGLRGWPAISPVWSSRKVRSSSVAQVRYGRQLPLMRSSSRADGGLRQVVCEGDCAGEAWLVAGDLVGGGCAAQQHELGGEGPDAGQLPELGDGLLRGSS